MDLFPLSHVGALLGVDPKTLRLWLHEAGLTAIPHPDDARQKCLSLTHIQQVADIHGRPLPPAFTSSAAPPPSLPPLDVLSQLAQMQLQIFTLQEQVTRLSLALLRSHNCAPLPRFLLQRRALLPPPFLSFLLSLMPLLPHAPPLVPFP